MLKGAFGVQTMERTQDCECFSKFKSDVTSVEDAEHSECPLTSKIN